MNEHSCSVQEPTDPPPFGALEYSRTHDILQRAAEKAAQGQTTDASTLSTRQPRKSDKLFSARLDVDRPPHMEELLAASAPTLAGRRRAGGAAVSPKRRKPHSDAHSAHRSPAVGDRSPRHPSTTAAAREGRPASSAAGNLFLRELASRLDECARISAAGSSAARNSSAAAPVSGSRQEQGSSAGWPPQQADAVRAVDSSKAADAPEGTTSDAWVAHVAPENDDAPQSNRGSGLSLMTQLRASHFPAHQRHRLPRIAWAPAAAPNPRAEREHASTSCLITEVGEKPSPPVASKHELSLLERLSEEPMWSYSVVRDATMRPATALAPRSRFLIGSADVARENLATLRHSFEYDRYSKQAEVLAFLDFRGRCRQAVCADATSHPPSTHGDGRVSSEDEPVRILAAVQRSERLCSSAQGRRPSPPPTPYLQRPHRQSEPSLEKIPAVSRRGVGPSFPSSACYSLTSTWSRAAAIRATEEERQRLCSRLDEYVIDFRASALSVEAMEALRTEVRVKTHLKPPPNLFCKLDLRRFLVTRHSLLGANGLPRKLDDIADTDIIDAMPTPAEAAFVRFAFEALPETARSHM